MPKLGTRDGEILEKLKAGKSNAQIAKELGWKVSSTKTAIHKLKMRMGFKHREQFQQGV